MYGNISEIADAGGAPGKRCLFFLTGYYPEMRLSRARVKCQVKRRVFCGVRCGPDSS